MLNFRIQLLTLTIFRIFSFNLQLLPIARRTINVCLVLYYVHKYNTYVILPESHLNLNYKSFEYAAILACHNVMYNSHSLPTELDLLLSVFLDLKSLKADYFVSIT